MKTHKFVLSALMSFGLLACKPKQASPYDNTPLPFKQEDQGTLLRLPEQDTLAIIALEVLDTDYSRNMGWAYRPALQADQGVLFVYEDSQIRYFYMKNTFVPLDIIFLNSEGRIAHFYKNAQPLDETLKTSHSEVQFVLEVPAGSVEDWQLEIGDQLVTDVPIQE